VKVVPRLEPDLAALREKLREGGHGGEPFAVEITDQEAAETIAWYLEGHPNVPFRDPQVSIRPEGVTAEGVAEVLGLRIGLSGRAAIRLRDRAREAVRARAGEPDAAGARVDFRALSGRPPSAG